MAHIHIFPEDSYCYTTNFEPCQSVALRLGVVLVAEKDIACTHSLAMKAYEKMDNSGETAAKQLERAYRLLRAMFKAF